MSPGSPRLAVILPVYNGENYLAEAIRSVLDQTYQNFELIVIDDGSTDRSGEIIGGFSDPRVRSIRFPTNQGLVAALNAGLAQAASELIARMDADDVCLPRRFERQVAFLDASPEVMICGTWAQQFGDETFVQRPPADPREVRARLFFSWAMDHPTIMMRRAFLVRHGLVYREDYRHVEDIDLFFRASTFGALANLPEVLLRTRRHGGEVSVIHMLEQRESAARLRLEQLRLLIRDPTPEENALHARVLDVEVDAAGLPGAEQWLLRLDRANRAEQLFDPVAFRRELRGLLLRLHVDAGAMGIPDAITLWRSALADTRRDRLASVTRLCVRATRRAVRPLRDLVRGGP